MAVFASDAASLVIADLGVRFVDGRAVVDDAATAEALRGLGHLGVTEMPDEAAAERPEAAYTTVAPRRGRKTAPKAAEPATPTPAPAPAETPAPGAVIVPTA